MGVCWNQLEQKSQKFVKSPMTKKLIGNKNGQFNQQYFLYRFLETITLKLKVSRTKIDSHENLFFAFFSCSFLKEMKCDMSKKSN